MTAAARARLDRLGHKLTKRLAPPALVARLEIARRDVSVISFPKSGRTWHRAMLGAYLDAEFDSFGGLSREKRALAQLVRDRYRLRIAYSHNRTGLLEMTAADAPGFCDAAEWRQKRVLWLVRDPRDVLVSAWHHMRYRVNAEVGELGEFVRDPRVGADKLAAAFAAWRARAPLARAALTLRYGAMRRDPAAALRATLDFLGETAVDDAAVARAVAATEFSRMRAGEQREAAKKGVADPRGLKVREGRVGGWREAFSDADVEYIAARWEAAGLGAIDEWEGAPW